MADRAGSLAEIRGYVSGDYVYGGSYDGTSPLPYGSGAGDQFIVIKVINWHIDFEMNVLRIVNNGGTRPSASSNPMVPMTNGKRVYHTSMVESRGGVLKAVGYIDPALAANQFMLILSAYGSNSLNLERVYYVFDVVNDSASSRYGYGFGIPTGADATFNNDSAAKLILRGLTGRTDDAGMQEIEFELHSQSYPLIFYGNI